MSASPVARQAVSQTIPVSKKVVTVNNENELPNDLSSTPGGSLYSTTPGGTRVFYARNQLLLLRNSPLARTPPANLPVIPGVTVPDNRTPEAIAEEDANRDEDPEDYMVHSVTRLPASERNGQNNEDKPSSNDANDRDDDQFQLDL